MLYIEFVLHVNVKILKKCKEKVESICNKSYNTSIKIKKYKIN